jgi:hypothetical protein
VALIANGTVTASCNAGAIPLTLNPLGYLKLAAVCITDLTILNSYTNEIIYTNGPPNVLYYTAQLTRFIYPVIRLLRTKTLTSEITL